MILAPAMVDVLVQSGIAMFLFGQLLRIGVVLLSTRYPCNYPEALGPRRSRCLDDIVLDIDNSLNSAS